MQIMQNNIYFEVARIEGSSLLAHARNALVDMFLKSRCQRLLFIDSDQGFDRNHIFALLNSNKPIIAGVTPHKRFPININFEPLEQDIKFFKSLVNKSSEEFMKFAKERADEKGEIEVLKAGTGCIMIDRSVFASMIDLAEKYVAFDNNPELKHHEFFRTGPLNGMYRGEDWYFCELAKRAGIPIYVHAHARLSHQGAYKWAIQGVLS